MNSSKQSTGSTRPSGPSARRPGFGSTVGRPVLVVVLLMLVVGIVGYLVLGQIERIGNGLDAVDARLARMESRVEESLERVGRAEEVSEQASARAIRAEASAAEAARNRDIAEGARARAESELSEAEAVAASAREEAAEARREAERIQIERQAELDRLLEALGRIVETRRTALGLVMDLGTDAIEFEFDRADLGADERELLSRIVGVLLTSTGYSVYVYGHTDDVGSEQYNQQLSELRADSVRDYLVQSGISSDIITTRGYGQSSPRFEGSTASSRARNRRVEIGIVDVSLDYLGEVRGQ